LRKISAAENRGIKLAHLFGAGKYIRGKMLTVSVRRDGAKAVGAVFRNVFKCRFEGGSLSSVYLVHKHGAVRHCAHLVKNVLKVLAASVVYNANVGKARIKYPLNGSEQLFIRLI
jgi:hypothetical protein